MIKRLSFLLLFVVALSWVNAQVSASFNANQLSGCPNPFLLILTDNSSSAPGPITSWSWTLTGPAGFVTQTSATNQLSTTLTISGLYSVSLTVCSGGVCDTETRNNYIEVFARPTLNMTLSPLSGCPPHQVCFDGTFTAGCGTITSSFIDVKDGTVYNNVQDVCHTYTSSGTYNNFTVSATNSCGCVTTINVPTAVTVSPAPIANFTSTNNFVCNAPSLNVTFTSTSTSTVAGTTYLWNIPGVISGVTTPTFTQSFGPGSYTVQLIVTNPNGCSDTITRPAFVNVGNPVASFSSNVTSVCPNGTVNFTNTSSGSPISYAWTFEGHGTSNLANPSRSFTTTGTWDVSLIVTYAGGCSATVNLPNYITVHPLPTNNFTVSDNNSCLVPFTTTFTNSSSGANSTTWTFTGGTPATFTGNGPVNVTYNSFGNFPITMNSTNAQGCSRSTTFPNTIAITALTAQITPTISNGCAPVSTTLNYTLSQAEPIASQTWTLPGSNIGSSTLASPSVIYNSVGCNNVTLSVTTTSGCVVNRTLNNAICAGAPPTGGFSLSPDSICFEDEEVCFDYTGSGADTILWEYGDSSPAQWAADQTQVCYSYSSNLGQFTVTMIPFQYGCPGDTTVAVDAVNVLGPIAAFTSAFAGCSNWNTFNFTNTATQADSVYYIFGDPSTTLDTSSSFNPSWTYPPDDTIRTYSITQFAYNFTTGCEHQITNNIVVYPPNADFTFSDSVGCAPLTITYTNVSNVPSLPPNPTRWNFVNTFQFAGAGINTIWVNGNVINKTYTTPGLYSITMQSVDTRGCFDTLARPNFITIHGVRAGFTQNVTQGCAPLTVNFSDTSTAPMTYIASRSWNFGVPSVISDTSNLQNPSFTFTQGGTYTVTLNVVDSFGCIGTVTRQIIVNQPQASFSLVDTFLCTNQNVGLSNNSLGSGLSFDWQFPNGLPLSSVVQNPASLLYAVEGVQSITLEVTDSNGCSDDTTQNISIFDVVAQGTASNDTVLCFANVIPISFTNNSINNVDPSSIFWDLGNGATSTNQNPSAIYNVAGEYVVSMSISSNSGCRDTVIVDTIFIGGPYANIQIIDRDTACLCETISFQITTWNTANPNFISGDGGLISYIPNGIIGDTIIDTLQYQYCQLGTFIPQVFIDDGTCSGNVTLNDTIYIDSLVVEFGNAPFSLCDTGTICFFDSSYNVIAGTTGLNSWAWDFGDGGTSTAQNPCHNYAAPGNYIVTLVVTSDFGCVDSITHNVYIPVSPNVLFGQSELNGCVGLNILFFDSSLVDTSTGIQSWHWDFGIPVINNDTSNLQNPNYTFNNTGVFSVTLTVTDSLGCSSSDTNSIEVFMTPTVNTLNDTTLCFGDSLQLSASGALNYVWTPNLNITNANISNPIIFPSVDATYIVEGIDANLCSDFDTIQIDVTQIQANFLADIVCLGDTTSFTDLSSSDGIITSWAWNFNDPISGVNNTSSLQDPIHFYLNNGTYSVNLMVEDDNSCQADTSINVFVSQAPLASFVADSACLQTPNTFNSSTSLSGGGTITSYHWDFGISGTLIDTSNLPNPNYTYANVGLYNVCLTVTTNLLCANNFDDTCFVVQVYDLPEAIFTADSSCLGNANVFTDLSQAGVDAAIVRTHWDFGQNPADTLLGLVSPFSSQFVYANIGQYLVELTVTDANSCESTSTETAFVFDNPIADFVFNTACQNQNNEFVSLPSPVNAGSLSYYWNFDEGAGYTLGDSIQDFSFSLSGNHAVSHVIVDALGCSDTLIQNINISNAPNAVITGDNSICRGTSTILSGLSSTVSAPPAVYAWSISASQTSNVTYSPNTDSQVFLTVTDNNGCFDTTSIFIDVLNKPNANFSWTDACEDLTFIVSSTTTLGDAALTNYTWNVNSSVSGFSTFAGSNFPYTSTQADTLSVTLAVTDANLCIDSFNLTILVDEQVIVNVLTPDYLICSGDELTLNLNDTTQFTFSGVGSVLWSPVTGIDNPSSDSIVVSPANDITYTLTAQSILGQCPPDADNSINIDVAPDPLITLDAVPNPVLVGASSQISASVLPFNIATDSLVWDNTSGTLSTTLGFNPVSIPLSETTYPIQLIYYYDTIRCVKDTSLTILVITECSGEIIYVPNIFTPNDDGKNDIFSLSGYGIEVVNYFRIFDRWGQLMYDGNAIEMSNGRMSEGWNGANQNDKICNSGVYVYSYELVCANGDIVKGSGNVTLIR